MDKIGVEYKSVFSDLFEGTRLLETGEKGGDSTINSLYLVIKGIETLYSSTTPGKRLSQVPGVTRILIQVLFS